MSTPTFAVAIMAAGKGTRLKSKRPKVLHEIGGKALLLHVIAAAKQVVRPGDIYVIVGHEADKVKSAVSAEGTHFVLQAEQRGTGHAIQQVKAFFAASDITPPDHLLVLSGDVPLIRPETITAIRDFHLAQDASMTILTAVPEDPTGYGRVIRREPGSSEALAIVEQKDLKPEQRDTPEINSGIYAFRTASLFTQLDKLNANNAQGELYLTDVASLLVGSGEKVVALEATGGVDEVLGANTIAEMMYLDEAMRMATARRLMAQGVTIFRPETCVIDSSVQVAADTVLEPFVQLLGNTVVGGDCRIRSYSVVQNSTIGERVILRNGCILDQATVANGAILGPYAHLRPESHIGEGAHVGNFVETKKVTLGKGSKANHLTYLGDAVIGSGTNIGAGVITCNYDGVNKHQTTIGDNVFIGSDNALVAPVTIGDGAITAAGSIITDNVPAGSLAIARSRQETKPGWADERRSRLKKN
ncbi:bifunctional UDP-N-acetylglucosamine diphosphorylase/glucosamine-1-phosphate N-acetyltransferase GlmU [Terriglobus tenax]|uniref:bifunctional UDP-N-acetylglucosamine diphosphorylase/glucosamine-1-phosphate N-acetyltransferase GlmU n=1 Tax=Terriglobus tenax TaxID=1111115 RepID=UPI0021DF752C|nr:bifunctional UDP-N-acetylglucosamine diphosphorylase/glucosamine-1-phosphate N-acetyltransferase GlmU [Terriglobus tenax]